MLIRDLFASDVTRDIPPVVYFHEQSPDKVAAEVSEYIVTGGWPEGHPNHRRVPQGIHEQYVRLLTGITAELGKPGGPELPNAWVSGFYGSGKSIFAKLLGLSLDGVALPDGGSLAEAWLRRDTSPKSGELRAAWNALRQRVDPLAVVFDIGSVARDGEHIHAAAVRQVQRRLGYCAEPLVADFELRLERDGEWARFEEKAQEVLGRPWADVKDNSLAEEDFSLVMSELYPDRYTDPMAWFTSRGGTHSRSESPEEAVAAIRDMLKFRRPDATLFLVIDEVSQYVLAYRDRVDRLRAFATALGAALRGRGLAGGARAAEARRRGGRLLPRLGEGPLPPEPARPPRADQHQGRRPQAAPAEAARRRGAASRPLRGQPARPQAVRLRLRVGDPGGIHRGLPDAPRADRPDPADHHRPADPLGPGPGRRPGNPRPAADPRRALPRPAPRRPADWRAGDPRPDLRGAAHRARRRRAGLHGPRAEPMHR